MPCPGVTTGRSRLTLALPAALVLSWSKKTSVSSAVIEIRADRTCAVEERPPESSGLVNFEPLVSRNADSSLRRSAECSYIPTISRSAARLAT